MVAHLKYTMIVDREIVRPLFFTLLIVHYFVVGVISALIFIFIILLIADSRIRNSELQLSVFFICHGGRYKHLGTGVLEVYLFFPKIKIHVTIVAVMAMITDTEVVAIVLNVDVVVMINDVVVIPSAVAAIVMVNTLSDAFVTSTRIHQCHNCCEAGVVSMLKTLHCYLVTVTRWPNVLKNKRGLPENPYLTSTR